MTLEGTSDIPNPKETEFFKKAEIFISTKADGNMSFSKGDSKALPNFEDFLNKNNLNINSIVCMAPVHGKDIVRVSTNDRGTGSIDGTTAIHADALIAGGEETDLLLAVKTGDCIPLFLVDKKTGAFGICHVGWKGLVIGILPDLVDRMNQEFQTNPKDLLISLGPSIGPECFLADRSRTDPSLIPYIEQTKNGEGINLTRCATDQLQSSGVLPEHLVVLEPDVCTYDSDKYFSHKKYVEKQKAGSPPTVDGRFVNIIRRKK